MINVKEFDSTNTLGNGMFDPNNPFKDTWAIQKAINVASGLDIDPVLNHRAGEEIYIPAGEYFIGDLIIASPVIIHGDASLSPEDQIRKSGGAASATVLHIPSYYPTEKANNNAKLFVSNKNGILITYFSIQSSRGDNMNFNGGGTIIKNIEIKSDYIYGSDNFFLPTILTYTPSTTGERLTDGELYSSDIDGAQGVVIHDDGRGNCAVFEYAVPGDSFIATASVTYSGFKIKGACSGIELLVTKVESKLKKFLTDTATPTRWRANLNQYAIHIYQASWVKLENLFISGMGGNGIQITGIDKVYENSNLLLVQKYFDDCLQKFDPTLKKETITFHNIADSSRITDCFITDCGRNGLFFHAGGIDCQEANIIGVSCYRNNEWGILDAGYLGNSYFGCLAEANSWIFSKKGAFYPWQNTENDILFGGSYTVSSVIGAGDTASLFNEGVDYSSSSNSYGTFDSCYAEGDNLPDFRRAKGILVVGGNLSSDYLKWDSLTNTCLHLGAQSSRIHNTRSKLNFGEQEYVLDDVEDSQPNSTRDIRLIIPDLHEQAAISFGYSPVFINRQKFDKARWEADNAKLTDPKTTVLDPKYYWKSYQATIDSESWRLMRGNREFEIYTGDANGRYDAGILNAPRKYDRAWIISQEPFLEEGELGPITPFGWTEKTHPLSHGHFFFGNSIANQPSYFSFKIKLKEEDLSNTINVINLFHDKYLPNPGGGGYDNSVNPLSVIRRWVIADLPDSSKLSATFSLESKDHSLSINPSNPSDKAPPPTNAFIVSEYYFEKSLDTQHIDPIFQVKIINLEPKIWSTSKYEITLNVQIKCFEMWPDGRFNAPIPFQIIVRNTGVTPGHLTVLPESVVPFTNFDSIDHILTFRDTIDPHPDIVLPKHAVTNITFRAGNYFYQSQQNPKVRGSVIVLGAPPVL